MRLLNGAGLSNVVEDPSLRSGMTQKKELMGIWNGPSPCKSQSSDRLNDAAGRPSYALGPFGGPRDVSHLPRVRSPRLELLLLFCRALLERLPRLRFGRFQSTAGGGGGGGFSFAFAALGFSAPVDCVVPGRGEPPFAALSSGRRRLLDQLSDAIVQVP